MDMVPSQSATRKAANNARRQANRNAMEQAAATRAETSAARRAANNARREANRLARMGQNPTGMNGSSQQVVGIPTTVVNTPPVMENRATGMSATGRTSREDRLNQWYS